MNSVSHKFKLYAAVALAMFAGSACGWQKANASPMKGTPAVTPTINFLGQQFQLASYNQKSRPMWEFTHRGESIKSWTTLLTLVDCPEAHSRADLDRLAQGTIDNYKSHGGQVLMAKTMGSPAAPYNYAVAAFEQPATHTFELNFVKVAQGEKNAYIAIYGVRITDSKDYVAKAKSFLNEHSSEIGRELEQAPLPALSTLPRREFE